MDLKKSRTIFLVGFLGVIVIWMVIFVSQISDLNRLTAEYESAEKTIAALTATTGALATEVVYAGSDAAVEKWAIDKRKWIKEGDHQIVIVTQEGTPATTLVLPTPTPKPQNVFQVWWELFFSTKP